MLDGSLTEGIRDADRALRPSACLKAAFRYRSLCFELDKDVKENAMRDKLIDMEKATIAAYQAKDEKTFTQYFSKHYVGIANDGIKTRAEEVSGMRKMSVDDIAMEGEQVSFPSDDVAILTYTMKFRAKMDGKPVSGNIYSSTVYAKEDDGWRSVLHTESMPAP
jgi:ketosteroid isomerase-like protein